MPRVADLLALKGSAVYTIEQEKSVYDAIKQMVEKNVGALIVTKEDKACGIFTERDYLRRIVLEGRTSRETHVRDAMTDRLIVIDHSHDLEDCMTVMTTARIRHLPVIENGRLAGIVSIGDIIKHLSKEQKAEIRYLTDYIAGKYPA
jgi:signal-transduction protein with cAMP-binding, CBS, and nucleotidyltransferase domain